MGSREGAGTGSFRWSFLELGFKIDRYWWLKIVYLPQQWMVRLDAGNEQLCESISSFWATLPRQNGRLWYIYTYILIALIIGNGGWLDSHMFRNTKMSLWKSGTVLLNRRSNDHSSPLPAASASMRHHTRRLPSVHKCVKMEISWIYKFASTKFELRKRVHWLHSSHAVFFRSGNPWKHHPVFILCLRSD